MIWLPKYAGIYFWFSEMFSENFVIFSELRLRRDTFLEHLRSASTPLDTVEKEFDQYMALLYGFIYEIAETGNNSGSFSSSAPAPQVRNEPKNSKLRYLQKFVWTNSMLGTEGM